MTDDSPVTDAFDAMNRIAQERLGLLAFHTVSRVSADDGFAWDDARRAAIKRQVRQQDPDDDFASVLASALCATYAEFGFGHDPAAVRAAVDEFLAAP